MKKPSPLVGALTGALLTIPLMAVMFAGLSIAGLPFTPFETFEWIARAMPGAFVNFGIDTMVSLLTAFGLSTAAASKPAEMVIALGTMLVIGAVAGLIYFVVLNATQSKRPGTLPGLLLGIGVGLPLFLAALAVPSSDSAHNPAIGVIWVVGVFVLWGYVVHLVWDTLAFGVQPRSIADPSVKPDPKATLELVDRRSFLVRLGAGAAVITVAGAGLGELIRRTTTTETTIASASPSAATAEAAAGATAGATAEATMDTSGALVPAPGTRAELTPLAQHYRIDINLAPPSVSEEGYTLPVVNAGQTLHEFTLDEIRAMPSMDAYITQACISNRLGGDLISTILWTGVSMQHFLDQVGIPDGATHLKMTAADGFDETVRLETIANDERVMLAWAWEHQPLTQEHGFPLRIHIPNIYGMKQPKWITRMEFLDHDDDGYWVRRGWDKEAVVRTTSVIDTVALDDRYDQEGQTFVPVGGIAWSGDRGVSRVQVRVDGGEWQDAQLRTPLSDRTWTLWRFDWPFSEGSHLFEVRCDEADGTPQIESYADVAPSGATGIVMKRV